MFQLKETEWKEIPEKFSNDSHTHLRSHFATTKRRTHLFIFTELGKMLCEKEQIWGAKLVEQVARDLQEAFPEMKGLSRPDLFNTKKFYQFYRNGLVQQPVGLFCRQSEEQPLQAEAYSSSQFLIVDQNAPQNDKRIGA